MVKISIDEYDITYAVKEWLIKHGWRVIAFNPPGAQGTFTIPNPAKDPRYRGQTGSKSPDILGIKGSRYLIMIESKLIFSKSDVDKLLNLVKNKERFNLLLSIVEKVCKANSVRFSRETLTLIIGKAHGGELNLIPDMETFDVSIPENWSSEMIDASCNPLDYLTVKYYPSNQDMEKIVRY